MAMRHPKGTRPVIYLFVLLSLAAVVMVSEGIAEPLTVQVGASTSDEFSINWLQSPVQEQVKMDMAKEVKPKQALYVAGFVKNFGRDQQLLTNILGELIFLSPQGEVLIEDKNAFTYRRFMAEPVSGFVMLSPVMVLEAEDEDPEGVYTIRIIVHDQVTAQSATGEYKIAFRHPAKE
jgi:hypothetical protein